MNPKPRLTNFKKKQAQNQKFNLKSTIQTAFVASSRSSLKASKEANLGGAIASHQLFLIYLALY
ncbi:MAG: hypothetical protein MUD14_15110 [Hydrococcus sp. Prado102]|jgi:hypothetical protein|nr:hypothetical protein [Hydrococcus sp. Prado102]